MTPYIARLGDTSTHGGTIITSAAHWYCRGRLIARKTDLLACPIHGINPIVEGSERWICEDLPTAREGDRTLCQARLISLQKEWICR